VEKGEPFKMEVPRIFPERVRLILLGGGKCARAFLETVVGDPSVEVLGIVEPDRGAEALSLAEHMGVPVYASPGELDLSRADIILNLTGYRKVDSSLLKGLKGATEVVDRLSGRLLQGLLERKGFLALMDPLTGLYNVTYFYRSLKEEEERGMRYGSPFALLFMDADSFKSINDQLGHLKGDEVLRAVAEAVMASLRGADIACRYGGDEFAVILPETRLEGAERVAERIRKGVEELSRKVGIGSLFVSIGLALFPTDGTSTETLVRRADWSMYQAKKMGGNMVYRTVEGEEPPSFFRVEDALSLVSQKGDRDKFQRSHSEVVSFLSAEIGKALGLNMAVLRHLRVAGALHDIGKAEVSSEARAWDYEEHAVIGGYMLRHVPHLRAIVPYILFHHERFDGKGFPKGLKGEQIPLGARVIFLADRLHHVLEHESQWKVEDLLRALDEIDKDTGAADPQIIAAFRKSLESRPKDQVISPF